jgi:heme/copper-type cytochrome/quinol oxidase subunit 2
MRRLSLFTGSTAALLLTPVLAFAQIADGGTAGPFQDLLENILIFTNTVLIPFILGIGFLVFVWGMFKYFIAGGANDDAKEQGKSLMIYATLGFILIIVFWGVVNLLTNSTGLQNENLKNVPKVTPI